MYFVIGNPGGDTYVRAMTKDQLKKEMLTIMNAHGVLDELDDQDTGMWGGKVLIIKGEMVVPKPVNTVIEWEV